MFYDDFYPTLSPSLLPSAGEKRSCIDFLQHSGIWEMQCQENLFSVVLALLKASGNLLRKGRNIFSYSLWWCCCLRDFSQRTKMGNKHEHCLYSVKVLVPLAYERIVSGAGDAHEQRLFCRSQMWKLKYWCRVNLDLQGASWGLPAVCILYVGINSDICRTD